MRTENSQAAATTTTHTGQIAGCSFKIRGVPGRNIEGRFVLDPETFDRVQLLLVREILRRGIVNPETFRLLRRKAGLKATELGELMGVSPTTVSNWETAKHPIPAVVWAAVAHLATGEDFRAALEAASHPDASEDPIELSLDEG